MNVDRWQEIFSEKKVRFIDQRIGELKVWESFAVDDALAESIHQGDSAPVVRVWTHPRSVVLGIADSRLPFLIDGARWLKTQGYQPVVRNSGGLAVALDEGVLNISLLINDQGSIGIHEGYEKMVRFMKALLADWTDQVEAFEVVGSYCPGDYDLSIGGKKFAGISQRRIRNGIAIQIYLSVTADHQARARLVREFYRIGIQGEETRFDYPEVDPNVMEALETILGVTITVDEVVEKLQGLLDSAGLAVEQDQLTASELKIFDKRRGLMLDRNQRALGDLFNQ
ncbi:biotin/lipoate A/B protein ligase family protein [Amphibacillus indicireducens]|uniref:Octanoyl-[GcvH]:protein N-octanoyltransferase n=1 Tax=Amphibacillus indicireducens TaxID=1076330 RepID=A0ABP7W260_9BACI